MDALPEQVDDSNGMLLMLMAVRCVCVSDISQAEA